MAFIFNYQEFLQSLKENEDPSKKELYAKWAKFPTAERPEDEPFFAHISQFETSDLRYQVPDDLLNSFDWPFLFQLVATSLSSRYELQLSESDMEDQNKEEQLPELVIHVESKGQKVSKKVSELLWFQVDRLYGIYLEEIMNLHLLSLENEMEKQGIEYELDIRLEAFKHVKSDYLKQQMDLKQKKVRYNILNGE